MLKSATTTLSVLLAAMILLWNCAPTPATFTDGDPVYHLNDKKPIPIPKNPRSVRSLRADKNARDVNRLDDVPASSWYSPRLGYQNISPAELVNGPAETGLPVVPITIIAIKHHRRHSSLVVRDSRGIQYLLKFAPHDLNAMFTTTSFIVNRLFWSFGYFVPEEHIFQFSRGDYKVDIPNKDNIKNIRDLLDTSTTSNQKQYRCIASRFVRGYPLGPAAQQGVRKEDPNDWFPHQDRRVLRALRVFAAFTNMADMGPHHTLDVYMGKPDQGHIRHYLIDFGDAFGVIASGKNRGWAGFHHIFSLADILTNLATLGFYRQEWEKKSKTPWKSVGPFESTLFNPEKWKEIYPYAPIRKSQPADNYWAVKILAGLTEAHISALVRAAGYINSKARDYMIRTLVERRKKLLQYHFNQVTPLEYIDMKEDTLYLKDICRGLFTEKKTEYYRIKFYDQRNRQVHPATTLGCDESVVKIAAFCTLIDKAKGYLRLEINKLTKTRPPVTRFHFSRQKNGTIKLIGVVHDNPV
ncbi:hypothetical protein GF407_02560 [candidate division KSB1 bacterium]|nr:hypothetical protein [candidate division KSB1 bacterium]